MDNLYLDGFRLEKEFKKDDYQDIYIGMSESEPREIVIINILKDKKFPWKDYKKQIETSFENIRYVEETEEGLAVVTRFTDGEFLLDYLGKNSPDMETKTDMFLTYLRKIIKYDHLDNVLKCILIDELQVVVHHDTLNMNELIVIGQDPRKNANFEKVTEKIGNVARRIFYNADSDETVLPDKIKTFIDGLDKNQDRYSSIYAIYKTFERMCRSDQEAMEAATQDLGAIGRNYKSFSHSSSAKLPSKVIWSILIFAATVTGYGLFRDPIENQIAKIIWEKPRAHFEKVPMKEGWEFINKSKADGKGNEIKDSLWEIVKDDQIIDAKETKDFTFHSLPGKYKITLKVKDKYNQWSEEYSEEVTILKKDEANRDLDTVSMQEEKFEKLNIVYDQNSNITKDEEIFRSGKYSMKIVGGSGASSMWVQDLNTEKNASFSMWILSDTPKDIQIAFKGQYQGNLIFEKTMHHRPLKVGHWEMIQISDVGRLDTLGIKFFTDGEGTIWVDDFHFDTYK